jgi:hypothetical protein
VAASPGFLCPKDVTIAGLREKVRIVVSSDFNGDGHSDILWQNDSGEVDIWELNGTTVIGGGSLGHPGPAWHVQPEDGFYQPEFLSRSRSCTGHRGT